MTPPPGPADEGIERGGVSLERRQRAQLGALDGRAAGLLGHEQGKGLDFGKLGHAGYYLPALAPAVAKAPEAPLGRG